MAWRTASAGSAFFSYKARKVQGKDIKPEFSTPKSTTDIYHIMQFSAVLLTAFAAAVSAANLDDVAFLTALVSDYDDHKKDYIAFFQTARSVPGELTKLAIEVVTYTDDLYTTLLDDSSIDVSSLKNYATNFPWYSRLQAEAGESGSAASTDSGSSLSALSLAAGSSSAGSGASMLAPAGALLGAVGILLL